MKRVFLDTNIFLRYLTDDPPEHAGKVERLLELAKEGEITLVAGPPVFFELAWTLKSFYKMSRQKIYECLTAILGISALEVTDIHTVEEALELYKATSADFADAYLAVLSKLTGADAVATFNRKRFKDLSVDLHSLR